MKMIVKELNSMKKQLDILNEEIGVYAIKGSWSYADNLSFQCDLSKLKQYAKLHDIPLKVMDGRVGIYIGKHWFFGL